MIIRAKCPSNTIYSIFTVKMRQYIVLKIISPHVKHPFFRLSYRNNYIIFFCSEINTSMFPRSLKKTSFKIKIIRSILLKTIKVIPLFFPYKNPKTSKTPSNFVFDRTG